MTEIKHQDIQADELVVCGEVEGKDVVDSRGKVIGRVKDIYIDPVRLTVEGITISNGLFNDKDFIGSTYIGSLSMEGAVLLITPITQYIGMDVLDSRGHKIGKVKEVTRINKSNNVKSITIDRGFNRSDVVVEEKFIQEINDHILLNDKARV